MSGHNHSISSTLEVAITGNRLLAKETLLEKRWPLTPDRIADLLADLVSVMLMLLLFVWVGLWAFVH